MKVLVTGSSGQLATSLRGAVKPEGLDLVMAGQAELDLAKPSSISEAMERNAPDLVVNAGAFTGVDKAESEPERAFAINGEGAGVLASMCAGRGIPIIHISTDYVFDGRKKGAYVESDATAPLGAYGRSKLEGEERIARSGARHVVLRTSWVHSPYGHNFVKTMLRLAATRPELGVVADQRGCPTFAPHLAEAVLGIASRLLTDGEDRAPGGIYHVAGSGETTWHGLAVEVFRCSAALGGPAAAVRPITTADYPTPAARPANSVLDCSKLARDYAIALPDWRLGVEECVRRLIGEAGEREHATG